MALNGRDSTGTGGPEPTSTLASRLRDLNFADSDAVNITGTADGAAPPLNMPQQQALTSLAYGETGTMPTKAIAREPQLPPASIRKRPNQAQRRQMSPQFSLYNEPPYQQNDRPSTYEFSDIGNMIHSPPSRPQNFRQSQHQHGTPASRSGQSCVPHSSPTWHAYRPAHSHPSSSPFSTQSNRNERQSASHLYGSTSARSRFPSNLAQNQPQRYFQTGDVNSQANFLDHLCYQVSRNFEIERSEIVEKEAFRQHIEGICREAISRYEEHQNTVTGFPRSSVQLKCFGSLSSGFATKASDMDLGLFSPISKLQPDEPGSPIPRLIEKAFLDAGLGARLLSRTRVPIIKLCENPPESLRQALLLERDRWENGSAQDCRQNEDGDSHEPAALQNNDDDLVDEQPIASKLSLPSRRSKYANVGGGNKRKQNDDKRNSEVENCTLRQSAATSLAAYYGMAKRELRKAGGRDVTITNYRNFSDQDWTILNQMCRAFVQGLHEPQLRQRLITVSSLTPESLPRMPIRCSLQLILLQAEGEKIAMAWENWSAKNRIQNSQTSVDQALMAWAAVRSRYAQGSDPVSHTKESQLALDKLKMAPFIQLMLLEQGQYESPSQYYQKTMKVVQNLRHQLDGLSTVALRECVKQYIHGIKHHDVRDMVQASIDRNEIPLDLEAVCQRHKSLQLANEIEAISDKADHDLEHGLDVAEYVKLLRSPLQKISIRNQYIIPVPSHLADLVSRIRMLQEVFTRALNPSRDKHRDTLEFPPTGAGVQCDINFSADLALQNTALLRCYSLTDPRVRPMVLFVKHWAKVRNINSGYRGTLSSYGYVLMVLHYLVNIAQPFVCPNLQHLVPQPSSTESHAGPDFLLRQRGYNVLFWRNEEEIMQLAASNQLNHNTESVGHLLRGFFEYFAHTGMLSSGQGRGFDWGRDVLSLRTRGGLLTKQEKGWTGARTVLEGSRPSGSSTLQAEQQPAQLAFSTADQADRAAQPNYDSQKSKANAVREIRHRYLFAIEDPFELEHNVARTVTHHGIVSIRDEFRRAWRIIRTGESASDYESLLHSVKGAQESTSSFLELLDDIHGTGGTTQVAD